MKKKISDVLLGKGTTVHSVSRDTMVMEAVDLMNRQHVGSVLVLEAERIAGIFTERDVLTRIVADERDPKTTRVGDVMTARLHTLTPAATVADALTMMTAKRCRHVPVVDASGTLHGLVSIGDMTKVLTRGLEDEVHALESYIGGPYLA